MLKVIAILLALTGAASAQTWTCTNGVSACQPGTASCVCAQVEQAPPVVAAPPACPFGTYWNGGVCITVPQAPVYIPPPVYYQHPYNPYWNTPMNQIPGWPGGHPHP